jgi:HSP20 family protein
MYEPDEAVARLLRFRQALEQLIEDLLPGPGDSMTSSGPPAAVDVFVHPDVVEIQVEVPGADASALEVKAHGQNLVVEGLRPGDPEPPGSWVVLERPVGRFRRVIELPGVVDASRATATLGDGVLNIRVPRIHDRRGREHLIDVVEVAP